jgi:D-alanyl-D-alanine carboxypeptidase
LIASTTKIMTALVVIRTTDLDERVKIMPEAVGIEGSSLYLRADEVLTVRELLLGLMLQSGNDAAVALAIFCGGTVEGFVDQMNEMARYLGLSRTHFANPNGLDDEQNYSTAHDLAVLAMYALEDDTFREIVSTKTATVGGRALTNHNKLLWQVDGAVGVKTGYTKSAGRILVGAAERNGRRLVTVTINAPDDWNDHAALFDYGFEEYETRTVLSEGECVGTVPVLSGDRIEVHAVAQTTFTYSLLQDETPELRLHLPRMLFAPVTGGAAAGSADVMLNGRVLGTVPLIWAESVFETPTEHRMIWQRILGD